VAPVQDLLRPIRLHRHRAVKLERSAVGSDDQVASDPGVVGKVNHGKVAKGRLIAGIWMGHRRVTADGSAEHQGLDGDTVCIGISTGCPFWLEKKRELKFDPLKEVKCFDDLKKFPLFEDEWLRGGPVRRWVPKAYAPSRLRLRDRRHDRHSQEPRGDRRLPIDYEMFSDTLPDKYFPKGSNWLMLGPSGPAAAAAGGRAPGQFRGGICFCIDLDPRWVIKLIKKGWMEHLEAYKKHCIDQAMTILTAGHDIKCMFATPKLLEALACA
jgi:hypothetical protein